MSARIPTMREDVLSGEDVQALIQELAILDSSVAAGKLIEMNPETRIRVLRVMSPDLVDNILAHVAEDRAAAICSDVPAHVQSQWQINRSYPEGTVGRLMDPPVGILQAHFTVSEAVAELKELVKNEFVTYGYVIDKNQALVGVIVMRDLLFAAGDERLDEIMIRNPFTLRPDEDLMEAMKRVVIYHVPVYPVCDAQKKVVGLVRGHRLFESQRYEIIAQAGSMVGVTREEQVTTPWSRSFCFRHPWLQLNLLTAFAAGAVVSMFQTTIDKMVILASFLPVLAGQSGNTGCQALAVTLRGLTLGELSPASARRAVAKEALLGFMNGALVGLSAGLGMYFLARSQGNEHAGMLAGIVVFAMIGSCVVSGISGALIPLALKKLGADPATASSIFLTTATDVCSMGMLLGLATWFLL